METFDRTSVTALRSKFCEKLRKHQHVCCFSARFPSASLTLTFNMVKSGVRANHFLNPQAFGCQTYVFDSSFKRAVALSMVIAVVKSESNLFTSHLDGQ